MNRQRDVTLVTFGDICVTWSDIRILEGVAPATPRVLESARRAGRLNWTGRAMRKAPQNFPASQVLHDQLNTIVSPRTWNKMRQNGARIGWF